jgi:Uncharacterized protein conserved in bacteria (DUF2188)
LTNLFELIEPRYVGLTPDYVLNSLDKSIGVRMGSNQTLSRKGEDFAMSKRTVFNVQPTKGGSGWDITKNGQTVSHHYKKANAVDKARDFGNGTPNSQLRIKDQEGKIQTEHTYGNDPRNIPG